MVKKIFKYQLKELRLETTVSMPVGAEILSIQMQGQYPCIWALCDPDAIMQSRIIEVYGTGHEIEEGNRKFIATVQFPGNLVFHFFELITKK